MPALTQVLKVSKKMKVLKCVVTPFRALATHFTRMPLSLLSAAADTPLR